MNNNKEKIKKFAKIYTSTEMGIGYYPDVERAFIAGCEWQKQNISNSIQKDIKSICKENTYLLDTPEVKQIIKLLTNS